MQSKSRRATKIWLILIGLLLSFIFLSGAAAPAVQLGILVIYTLIALAGLGVFNAEEVRRRLPARPVLDTLRTDVQRRVSTTSAAARRAQERAELLHNYQDAFRLLDIGLIVSEVGPDGMRLRRGEVSLDDQAVQPYLVLHADPSWTNETVPVRFEILDSRGQPQFYFQERVYLRAGQNIVLSSNRLPLGDKITANPGLWELRISVDGGVIGLHSFGMGASIRERQRLFEEGSISAYRRRQERLREVDEEDDSPVSLEELLRGHQRDG